MRRARGFSYGHIPSLWITLTRHRAPDIRFTDPRTHHHVSLRTHHPTLAQTFALYHQAVPIVTRLADATNLASVATYSCLGVPLLLAARGTFRGAPCSSGATSPRALGWLAFLLLSFAPASHALLPLSFVIAGAIIALPLHLPAPPRYLRRPFPSPVPPSPVHPDNNCPVTNCLALCVQSSGPSFPRHSPRGVG